MTLSIRRRLTSLSLAAFLVTTAVAAGAEPARREVSRLDLATTDTAALAQDLSALLAAAHYRRDVDEPDTPRNAITSVRRIGEMLHVDAGTVFVAIAERLQSTDQVVPRSLYMLEGGTSESGLGTGLSPDRPSRGAIVVDLSGEPGQTLLASLQEHLRALLPVVSARAAVTFDEVLDALRRPDQVAYIVLGAEGDAAETASRVVVVPDVLRISIRGAAVANAGASAGAGGAANSPPEVELVPDPDGGQPLIKFEFDPTKYDITKQR